MGNLPDLRILFYFALLGFACALILSAAGGIWLAHLIVDALILYFGA